MKETAPEKYGDYRVNLELFEGPLDLLLYLIKKNDLDIFDIPIAFITEEYLKYIDAMKELNIDVAGEFLLMAAELMHIKSRMLLPSEDIAAEEEELDPRADLVKRLLEYQRYKEAAHMLAGMNQLNRDIYKKPGTEEIEGREEVVAEGSVYELLEAFHTILKKLPSQQVSEITIDRISVSERIFQLIDIIKANKTISLMSLFTDTVQKHEIIVTFLAILEMSRLRIIKLHQGGRNEEIYITGAIEDIRTDDVVSIIKSEMERFAT